MNYPLISEYIEAIKNAEDNFNVLSALRPVYDEAGEIVMSSGNFAVVFKMKDESSGKLYAVKCFLREQEGRDIAYQQITDELEYASSNYLCSIKYYQKELFVDSTVSSDTEFPVLVMDWVEGVTLDKYVHQHISDKYALQLITYQFCKMAAWLMSQPFAHGDLKPDNILVTENGALVLVDYDGMFVPAMQGQKARELGSPDYRHPLRTEDCFNEHIDDFPLALIGMSLKAIALDASLLQNNDRSDSLLFSESDFQNIGECLMMKSLCALLNDAEFSKLYALFLLAHSQQELSAVSFRLFLLNKVEKPMIVDEVFCTEVTEEDFKYAIEDEYGVKYSRDGKKLLKAPSSLCMNSLHWKEYVVREGTEVICDGAFSGCKSLQSVTIPNSVTKIGDRAFSACFSLQSVTIPNSVTKIGDGAFLGCNICFFICNSTYFQNDDVCLFNKDKTAIVSRIKDCVNYIIPNSVTSIGDKAFSGCNFLQSVTIPNSVTSIGDEAFSSCDSLQSVTIPNSVTSIGDNAFNWCKSLRSVTIPNSVTSIGDKAFSRCDSLQSVTIPNSVISIGDYAFSDCESLQSVTIPNSVTSIGDGAFNWCTSLQSVTIPNSVTSIGDNAFNWCKSLRSITIPNSVTKIGDGAFSACFSLQSITIPNSVISIGDDAFSSCKSLQSVTIPNSVTKIGNGAFRGCNICFFICNSTYFQNDDVCLFNKDKTAIVSRIKDCVNYIIPNSVTSIGDKAFSGCNFLQSVTIPNSVTSIGDEAFSSCDSLQSVTIPNSVTSIGDNAFNWCKSLQSVTIPNSVTSIGDKAFSGCDSLRSITIPNSVTSIGDGAFYGCTHLDEPSRLRLKELNYTQI